MPQNIFGTDGVRGVANADLSCDLAFRLGRAATKFLGPDICIGRDTRLSGTMLESALTAGIMAEGGRPHCCGVIPTPAVALLTVQNELDGGIVISASHNPPEFNGIKFFSRKGMKLPDAVEEEISAWVMSEEAMAADTLPTGAGVGHIIKMKDARKAYVDHAIDTLDGLRLDGLVVAVDCGHGASCQTTPAALQRLGATVHAINTDYCGTDINVECGSTHLEPLRELVLRTHAEIVSTVMCNLGFSIAMKEQGFEMVQTAVGDRYVLERMLADGAVIGGEQSGHIIFLEHNTTGDGLVTALQLLAVLKRTGRTLTDLAGIMKKYPQVLVNVHSDNKAGLDDCQPIWDAVAAAEKELDGRGRILVRPSGTEPLVRVMAEAETHELTQRVVDDIVEVVKRELP